MMSSSGPVHGQSANATDVALRTCQDFISYISREGLWDKQNSVHDLSCLYVGPYRLNRLLFYYSEQSQSGDPADTTNIGISSDGVSPYVRWFDILAHVSKCAPNIRISQKGQLSYVSDEKKTGKQRGRKSKKTGQIIDLNGILRSADQDKENFVPPSALRYPIDTPVTSSGVGSSDVSHDTRSTGPSVATPSARYVKLASSGDATAQYIPLASTRSGVAVSSPPGPKRTARSDQVTKSDTTAPLMDVLYRSGSGKYHCRVCGTWCLGNHDWLMHIATKRHRFNLIKKNMKDNLPDLISDKLGVSVTSKVPLDVETGIIKVPTKEGVNGMMPVYLQNNGDESIELQKLEFLRRINPVKLADSAGLSKGKATVIPEGTFHTVQMQYCFPEAGTFRVPLSLKFAPISLSIVHRAATATSSRKGANLSQSVSPTIIIRYIEFVVSNEIVDRLLPITPFKPLPKGGTYQKAPMVVPGVPAPITIKNGLYKPPALSTLYVPIDLYVLVRARLQTWDGMSDEYRAKLRDIKHLLYATLGPHNFSAKMQLLLYLEEIQCELEMHRFDMQHAAIVPVPSRTNLHSLQVPGLIENRPSVMKNDRITVQLSDGPIFQEFEGYVHDVRQNEVWLGFGKGFDLTPSSRWSSGFNVRFGFNRRQFTTCHRALRMSRDLGLNSALFPNKIYFGSAVPIFDQALTYFDHNLEKNPEQVMAVQGILRGVCRPAPYLIFGPPGTGKTVTIVEAMKQIYTNIPDSHILACAPSNAAADILVTKLLPVVPKKHMFRMNAASRAYHRVPEQVRPYCNYNEYNEVFFPGNNELMEYRVVITTLATSSRISGANLPKGHITHVFIDEAGQATEPESILPLAGIHVASADTMAVLAGDPKQLGAVLFSKFAINNGLGKSMLERLVESEPYSRLQDGVEGSSHRYDRRFLTKLVRNYRSHADLLYVPNRLFYDGDLKAYGDKRVINCCLGWSKLPKAGFPLIFHGVCGEDMRESSSPSWFNPAEASVVVRYVDALLSPYSGGDGVPWGGGANGELTMKLRPEDIGIISPYRKQVEKLRHALSSRYRNMVIASTEEFQGGERTVIILSAVRSSPNMLAMDGECQLGFLTNPKRFNTAITRAKALLIIVGNPHVLMRDQYWRSLLMYAYTRGGYTGVDFEPDGSYLTDDVGCANSSNSSDELSALDNLARQLANIKMNNDCGDAIAAPVVSSSSDDSSTTSSDGEDSSDEQTIGAEGLTVRD